MTRLYAMWFDIVKGKEWTSSKNGAKKRPGGLVGRLGELHQIYGPIVRIEPDQLHILDMDAYSQIFKAGTPFAKDPAFYSYTLLHGSLLNESETHDAKPHKALYQPYFTRPAVMRLEKTQIRHLVDKFLDKLSLAAVTGDVVDLHLGFRCLTADIIMSYSFSKPFGALESPGFQDERIIAFEELHDSTPVLARYFPNLGNAMFYVMCGLPSRWIHEIKPLRASLGLWGLCIKWMSELQQRRETASDESQAAVFDDILNSTDTEKFKGFQPDIKVLFTDSFLFFGAGTDTTAGTLVTGVWQLLNHSLCLKKLQQELQKAMPDASSRETADWAMLDKLPYLRAVIKESLRINTGVPGKMPRKTPVEGAVCCGMQIPPGTVVSCYHYVYHSSETYFADALTFKPERWLVDEERKEQNLDQYLLNFSRGSRSCLGMNLAMCELYYAFGFLFRDFEIENAGTTEKDMQWFDAFVPIPFGHLKIKLRQVYTR